MILDSVTHAKMLSEYDKLDNCDRGDHYVNYISGTNFITSARSFSKKWNGLCRERHMGNRPVMTLIIFKKGITPA